MKHPIPGPSRLVPKSPIRGPVLALIVLAGVVGLSYTLLNGRSHPMLETAASAAPDPSTAVGVVAPTRGDVVRTIQQPGTIQGIDEARLFAKTSGYLKDMYVDKGDRVHAGQVLAVIENPEVLNQSDQARDVYQQSIAGIAGALASKQRAQADVTEGTAAIRSAQADERRAEAVVAHAQADLERTQEELPKLQSVVAQADASVEQSIELQAQSQSEVVRWQQQLKVAQANLQAAQATVTKGQADVHLAQLTYQRLKAIQDKDPGLVAAEDVDIAHAKLDTTQSQLSADQSLVVAAQDGVDSARQQVESAKRTAAAAARKIDANRSAAQAARDDITIARKQVDTAKQQVNIAKAQQDASQQEVQVANARRSALEQQVRVSDTQITGARMQSSGSRNAMSAAQALAGYTRIVAPFDGVVTERLADPGAFVQNAGSNESAAHPLLKVVRDGVLRVFLPVPEDDVPHVKDGKEASILVSAYPNQPFHGTVTRFATSVDESTRTMLTEIDIPNQDHRLRPGMYARVSLALETHRNAISVPSAAVMGPEDKRFVYTVSNNIAHRTPVRVGIDDGTRSEIVSGLAPDATVVLVGGDTLVDGARVKAEPASQSGARVK